MFFCPGYSHARQMEAVQSFVSDPKLAEEMSAERIYSRFGVNKKRGKPCKAMTALTWLLVLEMLLVWGGSMACATLVTAQQIYQRLYAECADYIDYVALSGGLRDFYEEGYGRYGLQYERPDLLDNAMLRAIAYNNSHGVYSTQYLQQPLLLRKIKYPMQTAVLFYDGDGNLLHKNGDFLYFNYATQEEWDAGEEEPSGRHYGWIDISEGKDAEYDPYARFRVTYSGLHSLSEFRVLRVTGVFEGTELKPVAVDFLTENMLQQALEQLEPTEHYFDESGIETVSYDYLISDLDRAGLLEWQTQFDRTAEAERPEELVTVYALRPEMSVYEGEPLVYDTWGEEFDSLVALTEELNFPAWTDVFKYSGGFRGMSEYSLGHILQFSGYAYRDWSNYSYEPDEPLPEPDFYMVTAILCHPLRYAVSVLRDVYIWTGLIAAALLLILRNAIQNRLVRPLSAVNAGMAEGWRYVYAPDNRPEMWREAEELYEHYMDELDRRHFDKNEITRLNTALGYAKKAEQNRRQMTSAIAHELKTPLAVVHSYAEGLKEHIAEDKREAYLDTILSETERMDGMVLDLLDLSRLEAGKVKLSRDEFSLSALVLATFKKLSPLAEGRRLTVTLDLDGDCPVIADESRIGQVIENFASNALHYTPECGTVLIKTSFKHGKAEFIIENATERPFTAEELSKVWDTFYQTDKARSSKGTGLGLAIAKSIVELHGGRCSVQNTKGGISFSFWIPN